MSAVMVTWSGFTEPEASPDQLENAKVAAAEAVRVTTVPEMYLPPAQLEAGAVPIVPDAAGRTEVVRK